MKNIFKRPFLLIFLIIVILNISYALIYNIKPAVDAEAYDEIALNIVNNGASQSKRRGFLQNLLVTFLKSNKNTPFEAYFCLTR
jgi:hypothetical protein